MTSPLGNSNPFPDLTKNPLNIVLTGVGGITTLVGTQRHLSATHHEKITRMRETNESLTMGKITPKQFVDQKAQDGYRPNQIKNGLLAWGQDYEGKSHKDPSDFDVKPEVPHDFWKHTVLRKPEEYKLVYTEKPPSARSSSTTELPNERGLRGGATLIDLQAGRGSVLVETTLSKEEEELEMRIKDYSKNLQECDASADRWSWSPRERWSGTNPIYEMGEQQPREYTAYSTTYYQTPLFETPVGSALVSVALVAVFVVGGNWLWDRVSLRWNTSKTEGKGIQEEDDPSLDQKLDQAGVVCATKSTQKGLDPVVRGTVASDSLLKVLTAFHQRVITKEAALSILKSYHNKTEDEALSLLEGKQKR